MNRFEHFFKVPVQFVLFFFGLVNAGVPLGGVGTGTWIVVLALLVGKPLGIVTVDRSVDQSRASARPAG